MLELTTTPQIDLSAIERADLAERTKYKYKREALSLFAAGIDPFDRNALLDYVAGLKSSRKAFLKSALRLISSDYEFDLKASVTPQTLPAVQSAIYRLEAMRGSFEAKQDKGTKAHTWLTPAQVKEITSFCPNDLQGQRDWIILGVLLGAGLRREELATLTFDAIKQQPSKNGPRFVLEVIKGKGDKKRVVPISKVLAERLRQWQQIVKGGSIARAINKKGAILPSLSAVGIFNIVDKYGKLMGLKLAPHDMRRTYAMIGLNAGIPLVQISKLLGHESLTTTQRYLDLTISLDDTISDHVPLSGD